MNRFQVILNIIKTFFNQIDFLSVISQPHNSLVKWFRNLWPTLYIISIRAFQSLGLNMPIKYLNTKYQTFGFTFSFDFESRSVSTFAFAFTTAKKTPSVDHCFLELALALFLGIVRQRRREQHVQSCSLCIQHFIAPWFLNEMDNFNTAHK